VHGISQIYHTYLKDKHSILHFQFASTAPIVVVSAFILLVHEWKELDYEMFTIMQV